MRDSLPFTWHIDYHRAVLQVPFEWVNESLSRSVRGVRGGYSRGSGGWLARLLETPDLSRRVAECVRYIRSIRPLLQYNLGAEAATEATRTRHPRNDAFTMILEGVRQAVVTPVQNP